MITKNTNSQYDTEALRLAAPSPSGRESDDAPSLDQEQRDLDQLCEQWVAWKASRRLYAPAPSSGSLLGQLSGSRRRPVQPGGPDAICSAELAAFHLAYTCQPDGLDKRVFDLYYVHRIAPVKSAAGVLKISRSHFYLLLSGFRKRLRTAALALMQQEQEALKSLQSARMSREAHLKE